MTVLREGEKRKEGGETAKEWEEGREKRKIAPLFQWNSSRQEKRRSAPSVK